MRHNEILDTLQNLTKHKPKQREIAEILGYPINTVGNRAKRNSNYSVEEVKKIGEFFGIDLFHNERMAAITVPQNIITEEIQGVEVTYRPDVYLSAGYGLEVYSEDAEKMILDSRLFITDRGVKINPNNCEIVTVSGNSMSPEYRHGDRVIIDKSVTQFIDGHIFAFKLNGECFIKEICLMGKRIKAIPLNKEYEPFYIEPQDEVFIFGRIIPRVRL